MCVIISNMVGHILLTIPAMCMIINLYELLFSHLQGDSSTSLEHLYQVDFTMLSHEHQINLKVQSI